MIYFLVFQKSHGYEKCACFLDLSKIVRCQRTASKHGDYFEFSLFEDDKKSSKFFHVKSVSFFNNSANIFESGPEQGRHSFLIVN